MIKPLLLAALALALLPALAAAEEEDEGHVAERGDIRVVHAWARATDGPEGVLFLEIESQGAADRLLGASSEAAAEIAVHGTVLEDGASTSRPLGPLDIPAGGRFALAPDAVFLKLTGLKEPLREGDHLDLELRFEQAGTLEVEAAVEAADARQHGHAGHAH